MSYAERLASYDDQYAAAPADTGGGPPPDGDYHARVEKCLIEMNERSKRLQLKTVFVVNHGENEGRTAITWHDLEDPERFPYTKKHLGVLGIDGPLSSLESRLPSVLDAVVEIRVKRSSQTDSEGRPYVNTYANRLVSGGGNGSEPVSDVTPPEQATAASVSSDDIPF